MLVTPSLQSTDSNIFLAAHYILPEYLVFPVVESFEELDKICFQRLIFPTPQLDGEGEPPAYDHRHKTPRTNSTANTITPPATDTESSGASPRSQLSSSVQSLPGEWTGAGSVAGANSESEPASPMAKSLSDSRQSTHSTPNSIASPSSRAHTDSSSEQSSERKSPRSRSRSLSSVPNIRSISSIVKLSPRNSPRQESPRIAPYKFHGALFWLMFAVPPF
jgi:hypothetical protein